MGLRIVVPVVALAIALAGCGSIGSISMPWKKNSTTSPDVLPSATAVGPVDSTDIGPPGGTTVDGTTGDVADAGTAGGDQSLAPPAGSQTAAVGAGGNLGRTDLLGGWTIASGSDSCQLFMTLTSWTGGYRASTRGCTDPTLKSIQAWNLQNGQVTLAGQGGSPVATLTSSGNNRFDGQANGQAISFFR